MGLFWDLLQQSQIGETRGRAESLEVRVHQLEREMDHARQLIHDLVNVLERRFGEDIDRDGRVGG